MKIKRLRVDVSECVRIARAAAGGFIVQRMTKVEECLSIREREKSGDTVRIGVRERENETQVCRPTRDV